MYQCPVCYTSSETIRCTQCGYDISCDYITYPTLAKLPESAHSVPRQQEAHFRCPECGSDRFVIDRLTYQIRCDRCGQAQGVAHLKHLPTDVESADTAENLIFDPEYNPLDEGGQAVWTPAHSLEGDKLLPDAVDVILETGQAYVSLIQRRLKLGYARSVRIIDELEENGIVGPFRGSKPRLILITREQWKIWKDHMFDVTSHFAGKIITMRSVQNGKYLCADSTLDGPPLMANRSVASDWEIFTISPVTDDGWIGIRAHNGKYLSAMINMENIPVMAQGNRMLLWEQFRIFRKGSAYYLHSRINDKWLSVCINSPQAPLRASADAPSAWERMEIHIIDA